MREWTFELIDTRVHAVILPMKIARDNEIKEIHTALTTLKEKSDDTNVFVREMAIQQLGPKRFEEVRALTVDSSK
jgi:hypothetical protein